MSMTTTSAEPVLIPAEQIASVVWNELAQAANDIHHPMRLVTLCTFDTQKIRAPNARLMVLRGADRALSRIWFHTDRRSRKISQLRSHPQACALAYDSKRGIQMCMYGTATLHSMDHIAEDHWQQTTISLKHAYGSPEAPAQPLPNTDPRMAMLWRHQADGRLSSDRSNFVVIQLNLERIQWMQALEGQQRNVTLYASNGWSD